MHNFWLLVASNQEILGPNMFSKKKVTNIQTVVYRKIINFLPGGGSFSLVCTLHSAYLKVIYCVYHLPGILPKGTPKQEMSRISTGAFRG